MGSWANNSLGQIHTPISATQILLVDIANVDKTAFQLLENAFRQK
jgi:hypothetical protein